MVSCSKLFLVVITFNQILASPFLVLIASFLHDFKFWQVVPNGFANYVAKSEIPSIPRAIDDTLFIPAAVKTDQEL